MTSSLDFNTHVNEVCIKANRKLSVLRSVKLLNRQTLDILYKLTVRSVIDYALPVYYNSLTKTEIGRLENLQYRAGKIVTGALHYTNKMKLNSELGWESIMDRGNLLSLNIFHKIHCHETRSLVKLCMPQVDYEKKHLTRSKSGYVPFRFKNNKFNNSFFPHTLNLWNKLPKHIQSENINDFKISIKNIIKPKRIKHFSTGCKLGNTLLTQIRVGRSNLNQHRFTIGFIDSPECLCHHKSESPEHYFLHCFLYSPERQILFILIEHYVPKFPNLNNKQKIELILNGINNDDPIFNYLNRTLTKAVQNFILATKRFTD